MLSSVITYNPSIPLTSNTINETVSSTILDLLPYSSIMAHQNSYFSRTVSDWNMLSIHLIEVTDTDTFKTELQIIVIRLMTV